jgi:antitoxin VapB
MATARVFKSGNSQAVRLPKKFRMKSKEVEIFWSGSDLVLRPKRTSMQRALELVYSLPPEIETIRRKKDKPQKRRGL